MNSQPTPQPAASAIAYLAQGRIRVKTADAEPRTIDRSFGNSIREKAVAAQQRHSWKGAGNDASPFSRAVWGKAGAGERDIPLMITSICSARDAGSLIYSLESDSLCALLEVSQLGAEERRLWNDNRTRLRHISACRVSGNLAFSVLHENGTANIGVKTAGEGGYKELTEGDSFDTAPRWVPGQAKIVFQSAGIGRNQHGQFAALGPFILQQLDPQTLQLETLLENSKFDYLAPQMLADGRLFYIRRPYEEHQRFNPIHTLKDAVLFPFRLAYAIFQFLNFFSAMFTGKKLTSAGGPKGQDMDMKQMMIWGNLVRAQAPNRGEEEGADLVPKSWELKCRTADGKVQTLASGVLAYDTNADGGIVYTNGNAVFLLHPDGRKERILTERMIQQVFFLPA
ncbi:MAG TPA: hypothetical protein VH280_04035 [Verrucomicrobiae bacterium]|jgi:hypothetical protein|nr:hypothetical protein [Verrucomicrobiae bacterium]